MNPRHLDIERMAKQAQVEIIQMKYRALLHIKLVASWHMRSLAQIRRFEEAKIKQGEGK